jgi:hypothetical protein
VTVSLTVVGEQVSVSTGVYAGTETEEMTTSVAEGVGAAGIE